MQWKESGDLRLAGEVANEWDSFRRALFGAGVLI